VAVVKPGRIMFELEGSTKRRARAALALASAKLPIRSKFVKRRSGSMPAKRENRSDGLRELKTDELTQSWWY